MDWTKCFSFSWIPCRMLLFLKGIELETELLCSLDDESWTVPVAIGLTEHVFQQRQVEKNYRNSPG